MESAVTGSDIGFSHCQQLQRQLTLGLLRGLDERPVEAPLTERDLTKEQKTTLGSQSRDSPKRVHAPLAVRGVQSPARRRGRALFRHAQHLQALPLRTAATVTRQHGGVHALAGRICTPAVENVGWGVELPTVSPMWRF